MSTCTARLSSLAVLVLIALIATGCGSSDNSSSSRITTLPNGKEISTSEIVDQLISKEPGLVTRLCQAVNQDGNDAALTSFEQGFKLSRAGGLLSPEEVFDDVVKHC